MHNHRRAPCPSLRTSHMKKNVNPVSRECGAFEGPYGNRKCNDYHNRNSKEHGPSNSLHFLFWIPQDMLKTWPIRVTAQETSGAIMLQNIKDIGTRVMTLICGVKIHAVKSQITACSVMCFYLIWLFRKNVQMIRGPSLRVHIGLSSSIMISFVFILNGLIWK